VTPHRTRIDYRVIYGDTDQAGMVYHANYLRWFEAARCEYLRERGMSYTEMNAAGVHFPVVEATLRYRRPARFEDLLQVTAWVSEVRGATLGFEYEIRRAGEEEVLVEGSTTHACTDDTGKPRRIPAPVRALVTR
jgi:acyl-CoA thioester hydrolase